MTTPIESFVSDYADALGSFDAERTAAMWGMPASILTDSFAGSLNSRPALIAALSQAQPYYRSFGLKKVRYVVLESTDLTERITRVRVRWLFHGADDEFLTDSDYEYVIRQDDDGLHAYIGISINEEQKLAELAQRRDAGSS